MKQRNCGQIESILLETFGQHPDPFTLILPVSYKIPDLHRLLSIPKISSIILLSPPPSIDLCPPDIGAWNPHEPKLVLPKKIAPNILFATTRDQLSFRLLAVLYNNGAKNIFFLPEYKNTPSLHRIESLIVRRAISGIWHKISNHLKIATRNIMAKPLGHFLPKPRSLSKINITPQNNTTLNFGELYYHTIINRILKRTPTPLFKPHDFHKNQVGLFIGSLRPGGAERQLVNTALGLAQRGIHVTVYCEILDEGEHCFYLDTLRSHGIQVKPTGYIDTDASTRAESTLKRYLASIEEKDLSSFEESLIPYLVSMAHDRPGIVHAWLDGTNIKAGIAAQICGTPRIILSQRNVAPNHFLLYTPYMRPGYKALIKNPNITLANNSKGGALDYARWLRIKKDRIKVIYNGLRFPNSLPSNEEISKFKNKHKIPEDKPIVGSVFRFYEEKRPLLWIKIANEIHKLRKDIYFLLAGEGELLEKTKKTAQEYGILNNTRFIGLTKNPALAMLSMDAFLLTSRQEGLPNVLIEAQSLGVPVIAPEVGGAAETFIPGKTGFKYHADTPPLQIAKLVLKTIDDTNWRQEASKAAIDFTYRQFSFERMINRTLLLYGMENYLRYQPPHPKSFSNE